MSNQLSLKQTNMNVRDRKIVSTENVKVLVKRKRRKKSTSTKKREGAARRKGESTRMIATVLSETATIATSIVGRSITSRERRKTKRGKRIVVQGLHNGIGNTASLMFD